MTHILCSLNGKNECAAEAKVADQAEVIAIWKGQAEQFAQIIRKSQVQVAEQAATIAEHKSTYDTNLATLAHNYRIEIDQLRDELRTQAATIERLTKERERLNNAIYNLRASFFAAHPERTIREILEEAVAHPDFDAALTQQEPK